MAKEKMSEMETRNREFIFVYEILGIICIIIAFISITRLGIVGKYGMLGFRLLFGDWYFLFIILLGMLGVYFLFAHQKFEIRNIRYLGVIVILLSTITLSHFSMHKFVSQYDENELKITISLYFDYFKNTRGDMMVGGGLIGCLLFYVCYYLFSSIGTIFVCLVLIFVGIVFISKKTVFDFILMIKNGFVKCFGGAFSLSKKMKGTINKFNNDYIHAPKVSRGLSNKCLINNTYEFSKNNKKAIDYAKEIKKALDHINIFYQDVSYIVCNHITVYFIVTHQQVNYDVLKVSLRKFINEDFLIRYDINQHTIIIEVNNIEPYSLFMKEAVSSIKNGNFRFVLGKDDRNQLIDCEQNILIIGNNNNYYRGYFISLLLFPMFHSKYSEYDIKFMDLNNSFNSFKNLINNYYNDITCIKDLKNELDDLLFKLEENKVSTIDEYNKINKNKIKKPLIFINGLDKAINSFEYLHDFEYYIMSGTNIGFQFIIGLSSDISEDHLIIKNFPYKVILKNNFSISNKYLGINVINNLNQNVEGFLKYRDLSIRISLLMIRKNEIEKISKRF